MPLSPLCLATPSSCLYRCHSVRRRPASSDYSSCGLRRTFPKHKFLLTWCNFRREREREKVRVVTGGDGRGLRVRGREGTRLNVAPKGGEIRGARKYDRLSTERIPDGNHKRRKSSWFGSCCLSFARGREQRRPRATRRNCDKLKLRLINKIEIIKRR